jgi:hypothetical protein
MPFLKVKIVASQLFTLFLKYFQEKQKNSKKTTKNTKNMYLTALRHLQRLFLRV